MATEKMIIKYIGTDPAQIVPGLGIFQRNELAEIQDPERVKAAKVLVKTNVNFERVSK